MPRLELQRDIVVIGAGAAGLMASIWAGRTARQANRSLSISAVDGAKKLGAKILVAGGGRCNVTHHAVDETAYAGSSRHAIKKVLRSFDVPRTTAFFNELGVDLKREETGKLFPTTDDAHTVLDALLSAARDAHVELLHPWRVGDLRRDGDGFVITQAGASDGSEPAESSDHPRQAPLPGEGLIRARRVILAAGGKALPRSGSDGAGYVFARVLGHTVTDRVFPALVPLVLDANHFIRTLAGLTLPATLELRSGSGKKLVAFTNSTLCTHFGLSGPSVLDISRYYTDARASDPGAALHISWLPNVTPEALDALLQDRRTISPARLLTQPPHALPDRLARALCQHAGIDPSATTEHLSRDKRRALVDSVTRMPLPITGDRGFTHAEVTAGGIPLSEIQLDTMESRVCPGLHICGEVCDVDGRIGGFNFQWAWASGYLAGRGAVAGLKP